MILSELPGDVLGLIFSHRNSSFLSLDLWKCGNIILNSKLAASITEIEMADICGINSPPLFLAHLRRLRSVRLSGNILDFPYGAKPFEEWSKSIHTLRLKGSMVANAIHSYATLLDGSVVKIEESAQLGTIFPLLTTLEINDPHVRYKNELISRTRSWPPTLTTLVLNFVGLEKKDLPFMATLPRSLTRLDATLKLEIPNSEWTRFHDDWRDAPPHLEYIHHLELRSEHKSWEWIPKSITIGTVVINSKWTPKMASSLVATVENLVLRHIGSDKSRKMSELRTILPLGLKSLEMQNDFVPVLPDSLTALHWHLYQAPINLLATLDSLYTNPVNSAPFWPSNLTRLSFTGVMCHPKLIKILPSTLLYLKIPIQGRLSEKITLDAAHFPPNLTTAQFAFFDTEDLSLIGTLPSSMSSIALYPALQNRIELSVESLSTLDSPSLTTMELVTSVKCDPFIFPSCLTKLDIVAMQLSWFKTLPQTLVHFCSDWLTESILVIRSKVFESLPRGLETFKIKEGPDPNLQKFTSSSFSSLPSLRVLDVFHIGTFPSATLRSFPKRMRELCIHLEKVEKKDLPFIPPYLGKFEICESFDPSIEFEDIEATRKAWPPQTDMPVILY